MIRVLIVEDDFRVAEIHRAYVQRLEGFTTKTGTSHQGLGLALARQVAQRRGGWLRVNNEGGAVFTALLPSDAAVSR